MGALSAVWFPEPAVSLWDPEESENNNKSQMNFSSVVLKRLFLEAKVTHQVHLNPTEISSSWAAAVWHHPGPCLTLLHWWTLICRPVKHSRTCLRLIRAGFHNRADERKQKTHVFIKWWEWTRNQRGCLSVTGSLNRLKGWSHFRFGQQKLRKIKNDYSQ